MSLLIPVVCKSSTYLKTMFNILFSTLVIKITAYFFDISNQTEWPLLMMKIQQIGKNNPLLISSNSIMIIAII